MPIYTPPYTTLTLDANNQRAAAALLATTTWTGTWTLWGQWNKLDLVGSIDQAGTLFIDQSRDGGATTATTEQWAGAIGEAFAFPTARGVGCNAYRLRFTAGGVNLVALTLTPYLTVGEVDQSAPIRDPDIAVVVGGGNHTFVIPVGARHYLIGQNSAASPTTAAQLGVVVAIVGFAHCGPAMAPAAAGFYSQPAIEPIPPFLEDGVTRPTIIYVADGAATGADVWAWFYA